MIKRIIIDALALAVATLVVPGINIQKPWWPGGVLTLLGVAVIFGIANAIVKPLFKKLTGCLVMLTFGLFLLVINGALMLLVSWVCGQLGLGWSVQGTGDFWTGPPWWSSTFAVAIEGGIIVAVVSFLAAKLLKDRKS